MAKSAAFLEDRNGRLPLRANPHMHLLEAALDHDRPRSGLAPLGRWHRHTLPRKIYRSCFGCAGRVFRRLLAAGRRHRGTHLRTGSPLRMGILARSLVQADRPKEEALCGVAADRIRGQTWPRCQRWRGGQRRPRRWRHLRSHRTAMGASRTGPCLSRRPPSRLRCRRRSQGITALSRDPHTRHVVRPVDGSITLSGRSRNCRPHSRTPQGLKSPPAAPAEVET